MRSMDSASPDNAWKRAARFIWRWAPHVASLIATAGITIGAIILGSGDYSQLSKGALNWGWSMCVAGFALLVFATLVNGSREQRRTALRAQLANAERRAATAEERGDALHRALEEGLRSRLLQTRDDLDISPDSEYRITLYSHDKTRRELVRRARLSGNHLWEDVREGRTTIPDDSGLIGQALTKQTVSVYTVTVQRVPGTSRPAWENWMVSEGFVAQTVAADLRMETCFYMFAPVRDTLQDRTVGMLVIEFTNATGTPTRAKLKDSMSMRGRDLAISLSAVERELDHTTADQSPARPTGPRP